MVESGEVCRIADSPRIAIMVKYMLCKINPHKRNVWLDWCNVLMTVSRDEATETLVEEDLLREMCLIFGQGDDSYVLYRHESLPDKEKKPANMGRALNRKHFEVFRECLTPIDPQTVGYDIVVTPRSE